MGHIAHLLNQFQVINKLKQSYVGWKKTKSKDRYLPIEKGMDVYFHNS